MLQKGIQSTASQIKQIETAYNEVINKIKLRIKSQSSANEQMLLKT